MCRFVLVKQIALDFPIVMQFRTNVGLSSHHVETSVPISMWFFTVICRIAKKNVSNIFKLNYKKEYVKEQSRELRQFF